MQNADIKQVVSATRHDIIEFVYGNLLKSGWQTSFNYLLFRPRQFLGKPLVLASGVKAEFDKYINYCYSLSNNYSDTDEAARYKDKYGTGIYFSVVLYWLLVRFGVLSDKKLKFCQGYFSYKLGADGGIPGRYRAGIHAWLAYNSSIIDVTLWTQKQWFDFDSCGSRSPVVTGEIPQGINLVGFEEERKLTKEYARRFARDSGLTFVQWVDRHKRQADLYARSLEQPI